MTLSPSTFPSSLSSSSAKHGAHHHRVSPGCHGMVLPLSIFARFACHLLAWHLEETSLLVKLEALLIWSPGCPIVLGSRLKCQCGIFGSRLGQSWCSHFFLLLHLPDCQAFQCVPSASCPSFQPIHSPTCICFNYYRINAQLIHDRRSQTKHKASCFLHSISLFSATSR